MSIIVFIILGLVAGLLARAFMPGRQGMGLVMTAVLGMVGSFVGGFLASLVTDTSVLDFNTTGLIGSIIGAMVVLAVVSLGARRGAWA